MKKIYLFLIIFAALFFFSGCRYRISREETYAPPAVEYATALLEEDIIEETPPLDEPEEAPTLPEPVPEPEEEPTEPPIEYVTYIEAVEEPLSPLTVEVPDDDAHRYATQPTETPQDEPPQDSPPVGIAVTAYEPAESTITVQQPADVEGEVAIGADGGVVGLVATYSTLLRQGVNSIFPCQLMYVYVETAADFVTVGRGTPLYRLVADSGGVNVSSRLTADRLLVEADWVVRRNPDVIVKIVDETVLGSGIFSTHAASAVAANLRARPYWGAIEAVRNNRILLFPEQILENEATRLAAQLLIAYKMYPELFEAIDINSAISGLLGEVTGIYFYRTI